MEVRVEGIVKKFGTEAALRSVSLAVREGSLVALLGPSGSGKTTLLRVIAGLEIPDAGRIWLGGQDATQVPVQARQVGFVFQHYALFRHLSVFENVAYGLRSRPRATRPNRAEIARRVGDLLDLVQLPSFAARRPAQLSGGQRQRVALARALAVEPRVLLLDEPFGALDAQVRKDLRRWMRDIHDRTGQTTIFVTHDQDEALELADEVAVLNAGRIEQVGTPAAIQGEPATAFVMSFVGTAARLPVTVEGRRPTLNGRTLTAAIPASPPGPGTLFCRPWEFELVDPGAPEADLAGLVMRIWRVGPARRVEVALEGGERVEVDCEPSRDIATGERVGVAVTGGRVFADDPVIGAG